MFKKAFLSLLPFLCILVAWSNKPNVNSPVCIAPGEQNEPLIVTDGGSGYFVFWWDERGGIYGQRLNSKGDLYWPQIGKKIIDGKRYFQALPDGNGGAYLVYSNYPNEVYVYRIDSEGNPIADNFPYTFSNPHIAELIAVSDKQGNCFIASIDDGPCSIYSEYTLNIRKILSSGTMAWFAQVDCLAETRNAAIIPDELGGCIAAWEGSNDSFHEIHCTRLDSDGRGRWHEDVIGTKVTSLNADQKILNIKQDGTGGTVVFFKVDNNVYAQRINTTGNKMWGPDGVFLSNGLNQQFESVYTFGDDVIIIFMENGQLFAERRDLGGNIVWQRNLKSRDAQSIEVISDDQFGAIITWLEKPTVDKFILMAQRIDSSGKVLWALAGVPISLQNISEEGYFSVLTDKDNGAVLVWNDPRNENMDIFAQRICSNGKLGWWKPGSIADITASRSGGIAPAEIAFDCNNSYSPNGEIIACTWDFGDKTSGFGFNPTHTFNQPGKYKVWLDAKDSINVQAYAERTVIIYSPEDISAGISVDPYVLKANGRESANIKFQIISGKLYSEELQLGRPKPVKIYLAPELVVSSGTIYSELLKPDESGLYYASLVSGDPGIATVTVKVDGQELATVNISYTWLQPPLNPSAYDEIDRSLFKAKRSVVISWSANPGEIFTPKEYNIYRSTDDSPFNLIGHVNANVYSFRDSYALPDKTYTYRVTMVDVAGDESDPSAQVTLEPLNGR